jgi:hypothetical protein
VVPRKNYAGLVSHAAHREAGCRGTSVPIQIAVLCVIGVLVAPVVIAATEPEEASATVKVIATDVAAHTCRRPETGSKAIAAPSSQFTPSRVYQLRCDGRDSEKGNNGRLVRTFYHPVIMRPRATRLTNPPAGTGTALCGSKSGPLFTHHTPERTTDKRSVAYVCGALI